MIYLSAIRLSARGVRSGELRRGRGRGRVSAAEPRGVEVADQYRDRDPEAGDGGQQLADASQGGAPGERQERRRLVEVTELSRIRDEFPAVLVRRADQREEDEPAEEGHVRRMAVRQKVEEAEEHQPHHQGMPGDPV